MTANGFNFGFTNQQLQANYANAIYQRAGATSGALGQESQNLGNFQSTRMQSILQQLSQYVDPDLAHVLRGNVVDTVKANQAHQFFKKTSAQLDAADIKADFSMAQSYLGIVA